jgi:protocatechuate 3,4-dioxygenase beta subunit
VQKGLRLKCTLTVSLFVLMLALAGCGGSESQSSSEDGSDTDSSTETTSTVAGTEPTAGEETSAQAASSGTEEGARSAGELASCEPTQPDMLGPFYEPGAPVRNSVGSGYVLSGAVLAAGSCEPIPGAQIEFWLANPEGVYDDAHRATMLAGAEGEYQFESSVPVPYENRPPHIHVRVTAPGYQDLVTQHYPDAGQTEANFDLVLGPA